MITPYYAPDYGPSAPIYTALCEDLLALGDEVRVVTGFPNYGGADELYPHPKRLVARDKWNGVPLLRVFLWKVPRGSLLLRMVYHVWYNFIATLAALWEPKVDVVVADAPILWGGLPLLVKAILPRTPFIYVVNDIYPDVLVKLGMLSNPRLIGWIERIEKFYYDHASAVVVISEGFKQNLLNKGVPENKVSVVPISVDSTFFIPHPKENALRDQWNLNGKFVVLYAGNIGFSQGLEVVLEAAKKCRDHPEIIFVIVGEGSTKPGLQEKAAQEGLENVVFFPFQPREVVPQIYAMADVCLVTLKKEIVVESVPSKTYTILASGRPLIATVDPGTEVWNLVNQTRCGVCIEPENADELAKEVIGFYRNPDAANEMGVRGREYAVANCSRMVAASQYHAVVKRIAKH